MPPRNVIPAQKICKRPQGVAAAKRAKAALRQKAHRAREKQKKLREQAADRAVIALLERDIGHTTYTNYQTLENIEWVLRVGYAPSAGGARSPLAGIVNAVSCRTTNRWAVECYRWRCYIFSLLKERELRDVAYGEQCFGVKVNFDETPCRLFSAASNCATSMSVQVRCVSLYGIDGVIRRCAPRLAFPTSGCAAHLFDALNMDAIGISRICAEPNDWRFILVVPDGAASNRNVLRSVVAYAEEYPRLIVVCGTCVAHVLSNATKWGLGDAFPYGQYLRISHLLQAKGPGIAAALCEGKFADGSLSPDPARAEFGLRMWSFFLERVFSVNGPFNEAGRSNVGCDRIRLFHSLWPHGVPGVYQLWDISEGRSRQEYSDAVGSLFRRTAPTPILSRWYSVEVFAWYLMSCRIFGVLSHVLTDGLRMTYWPGDNPLADGAAYAAKSLGRVGKALLYVRSDEFVYDLYACAISSVPRWVFAQHLFSEGDAAGFGCGLSRACIAYVHSANHILRANNDIAEQLLNAEPGSQLTLRLRVYHAMAASLAYLSEKNLPYTSTAWRIIRGEIDVSNIEEMLSGNVCCAESGLAGKILRALEGISDGSRCAALHSLSNMFRALIAAFAGKDGCHNLVAESSFSMLRNLGLKLPYRPPKLSTCERELVLRHYRCLQQEWFRKFSESAHGTLRQLKAAHNRSRATVNGFSAFRRSLFVAFDRGRPMWAAMTAAQKTAWAEIACEVNRQSEAARGSSAGSPAEAIETGPLGSRHRSIPICASEVHERLHEPSGELQARWSKKSIKALKESIDCVGQSSKHGQAVEPMLHNILLPGDRCAACAEARRSAVMGVLPLYVAVSDYFKENNCSNIGLAVALEFPDGVVYVDVVIVMRNPRRLLCVPLDVTDWRELVVPGLGRIPRAALLKLPNVFDGRSLCLLDLVIARQPPIGVWVLQKHGVICAHDGWSCVFKPGCAKLLIAPPKPRCRTAARRPDCQSRAFGLREYAAAFGDTAEPRTGNCDPEGMDSDAEPDARSDASRSEVSSTKSLVKSWRKTSQSELVAGSFSDELRIPRADQESFSRRAAAVIDCSRYAVAARLRDGLIIVFWKDSEKRRHWERFVAARRRARQTENSSELTSSKSSTLGKHTLEGCIRRARAWQQWHAAWVYGVAPTTELGRGMFLPPGPLVPLALSAVREISSSSDGGSDDNSSVLIESEAESSSSISSSSSGTVL